MKPSAPRARPRTRLELRTRDRYRKLIAKIDKALKRIEEGRYGYLRGDRRGNRPRAARGAPDRDAVRLDAQERWEHRQKQMGD